MQKFCFMFGHRDTPDDAYGEILDAAKEVHVRYGITDFIAGGYGSFDRLAQKAILALKKTCGDLRYIRLLPYHPEERKIEIDPEWDGTVYPDGMEQVPRKYAIVRANRYMLDRASAVICCAWHTGNARNLYYHAIKRAEKEGIAVKNIAGEKI